MQEGTRQHTTQSEEQHKAGAVHPVEGLEEVEVGSRGCGDSAPRGGEGCACAGRSSTGWGAAGWPGRPGVGAGTEHEGGEWSIGSRFKVKWLL